VATSSRDHQLFALLRAQREFARQLEELAGEAQALRIWFFLSDREGARLPVLVPVEGVPLLDPPYSKAPLRALVRHLALLPDVAAVACVLERPGQQTLTRYDQMWMRAIRETVGESTLSFVGVALSCSVGARLVTGDEWM
jgi:hypothetical protein